MIEVNELTKFYDEVKAVDKINFSIEQGEIVGLLGPNGAGKSTTLRMLTCYLTPTGGDALIGGKNVNDSANEIKKMIGYLPESAPLYADMVVYDYLGFIAKVQEVEKDKIEERIEYAVQKCGLEKVIHRNIRELSKGYRQRVGLGHAIVHDPEILVLDEPTSGLDPNQIVEIRSLIKELGKEKTVILSTHILSEVEASCDRAIIISSGKIVADNSIDELMRKKDETSSMTIKVKGAGKAEFENLLSSVEGVQQVKIEDSSKLLTARIISGNNTNLSEDIYSKLKATDWMLHEMKYETQTLESIFQQLTTTKEEQNV